jgi:hypothetical protein
MTYHTTDRWGVMEHDAPAVRFAELLDSLEESDDQEHPEVGLTHESGWTLSVFRPRARGVGKRRDRGRTVALERTAPGRSPGVVDRSCRRGRGRDPRASLDRRIRRRLAAAVEP